MQDTNIYIQKYKKYISFLNENRAKLLNEDDWGILLQVLPLLKLSEGYTLDDYRSKKSTDNILCLYARKIDTPRPAEDELKKYEKDKIRMFKADISNLLGNPVVAEGNDRNYINDDDWNCFDDDFWNYENKEEEVFDEAVILPEKIMPEAVITLDFLPDAIWEAYLLNTTDYYIGQRWHGNYHQMTILANFEELISFRPWHKDEFVEYKKFIRETNFEFEPKITIDGNVATIEHLAVFYENRISRCRTTARYDKETRRIESFKFEYTDLFEFSPRCKV